jgi:putative NADH-flavin reductase
MWLRRGVNDNFTTVLDGIRRDFPEAKYAAGCTIASNDTTNFAAAVSVAKASDVTIAVMGIDTTQEFEGGTRTAIELPGVQSQLLTELRKTSTTLILILLGGSALAIATEKTLVDTIVWAGYGGEEAGSGLADVLFGRVVPSGRLPITFYSGTASLAPFESCVQRPCHFSYHPPVPCFPRWDRGTTAG